MPVNVNEGTGAAGGGTGGGVYFPTPIIEFSESTLTATRTARDAHFRVAKANASVVVPGSTGGVRLTLPDSFTVSSNTHTSGGAAGNSFSLRITRQPSGANQISVNGVTNQIDLGITSAGPNLTLGEIAAWWTNSGSVGGTSAYEGGATAATGSPAAATGIRNFADGNDVHNHADLAAFQGDQFRAILLKPTGAAQVIETYLPGNEGEDYDNAQWVQRGSATVVTNAAIDARIAAPARANSPSGTFDDARIPSDIARDSEIPDPSSQTPAQTAAAGAVGTSGDYARADHVHADRGMGGGGGLSTVATSDPVSGDGSSGDPVTIADGAIDSDALDSAVSNLLLPTLPATGMRDNMIPKFDGDTLGWEADAGAGSTTLLPNVVSARTFANVTSAIMTAFGSNTLWVLTATQNASDNDAFTSALVEDGTNGAVTALNENDNGVQTIPIPPATGAALSGMRLRVGTVVRVFNPTRLRVIGSIDVGLHRLTVEDGEIDVETPSNESTTNPPSQQAVAEAFAEHAIRYIAPDDVTQDDSYTLNSATVTHFLLPANYTMSAGYRVAFFVKVSPTSSTNNVYVQFGNTGTQRQVYYSDGETALVANALKDGMYLTLVRADTGANKMISNIDVPASGGSGLSSVSSDATLTGDGTSGDTLKVASPLPAYPTAGMRDNMIPKFDGDTLGWEADATASGGTGISSVTSDSTLTGDGTSGTPLGVADDAIDSDKLANAIVARLLPTLPSTGMRDNLIPKFDGDTLGWEADATASGGTGISSVTSGSTLSGDGTSGSPLNVANNGITSTQLAAAVVALLLPALPTAGMRDNMIPKFNGDTLGWESDATGSNVPNQPATPSATTKYELQVTNAGVASWVTATGGTAAQMHNIYAAWSADATVTAAELTSGADSDTNTVTLPTSTGNQYLGLWRSDTDGGDPSEVHIAGGGNARNTFGTATDLTVSGQAGKLIVSTYQQNSALLSGEEVRLV